MAKRGGQPLDTAQEHLFDLSSGSLCLDFANTVPDRPHCRMDHLASFAALLCWSRQAGILEDSEVERLARRAARCEQEKEAVFRKAIRLRQCLYNIFSAVARCERPIARDLSALNRELTETLPRLRLADGAEGLHWQWSGPAAAPDRMLWPVVRSAADLLTSEDLARVRECASERCSWLFLDRSRTRRRRWCDMKTCGNRAKARRHYLRRKAQKQGK